MHCTARELWKVQHSIIRYEKRRLRIKKRLIAAHRRWILRQSILEKLEEIRKENELMYARLMAYSK